VDHYLRPVPVRPRLPVRPRRALHRILDEGRLTLRTTSATHTRGPRRLAAAARAAAGPLPALLGRTRAPRCAAIAFFNRPQGMHVVHHNVAARRLSSPRPVSGTSFGRSSSPPGPPIESASCPLRGCPPGRRGQRETRTHDHQLQLLARRRRALRKIWVGGGVGGDRAGALTRVQPRNRTTCCRSGALCDSGAVQPSWFRARDADTCFRYPPPVRDTPTMRKLARSCIPGLHRE